jgi:hypothetical protein
MAAGTDANRHLIAGLLEEFSGAEGGLGSGLTLALEADGLAPLGGCAEA